MIKNLLFSGPTAFRLPCANRRLLIFGSWLSASMIWGMSFGAGGTFMPKTATAATMPKTATAAAPTPVLKPAFLAVPRRQGPEHANRPAARARNDLLSLEINEGRLLKMPRAISSVFVANSDIADVAARSERLIYIYGREPGETTLFAVTKDDEIVARYQVVVNHNLERLNHFLSSVIASGTIVARGMNGALLLEGAVAHERDAADAMRIAERFVNDPETIINQIRISAPNQVNLQVRFAEISREIVHDFGFSWDANYNRGGLSFGLGTGRLFAGLPVTLPDQSTVLSGALSRFPGFDLASILDLLSRDSLVRLLAEPNLTARSGESASFLAGGEFPIPVQSDNGQVTLEYKRFGVSLNFTPTILSNDRISLHVSPEVSELSQTGAVVANGFSIPSLRTRQAETTVELASGQSLAIAGLFQNSVQQSNSAVPGLSELPILGALFRSDHFERQETELVVLVTPYVIAPAALSEFSSLPSNATDDEALSQARKQQQAQRSPDVDTVFIIE